MVKQVHILVPDFREIVYPFDLHGLGLHPMAVLPVASLGGNLPDIDLRVEVCGEGITMVAGVAV